MATTQYFVKMNEKGDAPSALYRWVRDDVKKTIQERVWSKKDKEWKPTNSVTESRLTGGDIEGADPEMVKKFYPDAL